MKYDHQCERLLMTVTEVSTSYAEGIIIVKVRRCLHEKTCTWLGELNTRMTNWFRIAFTLFTHFPLIGVDATLDWRKAPPVPVHGEADLIPKQVVVLRLHDTARRFHTGMKFSLRCKNCRELAPGWLIPIWKSTQKQPTNTKTQKGNKNETQCLILPFLSSVSGLF